MDKRQPTFGNLPLEHAAPARREFKITWDDGSPRDLSGLTPYFRVYSNGDGSAPLFPEVSGVLAMDSGVLCVAVFTFWAAQLTRIGGYYAEMEFRDGSDMVATDGKWHGIVVIS